VTAYTDQAFMFSIKDAAFITKVVGVTYTPNYPRWVEILMSWCGDREREQIAGVLIRNPSNPHDENAIEVHVPALESCVGFLPTRLAAYIAPKLDEGWRPIVEVWAVRNLVDPEYPGVRAKIRLVSPP
jgi:hypothetical protein